MKRFISLFLGCVVALGCSTTQNTAMAQSAEDIVNKMDEVLSQDHSQGLIMTMDMKIPLLGSFSTTAYVLGEKMRAEANIHGQRLISWQDETTSWTYDLDKKEIVIENRTAQSSETEDNAKMLEGITDGYSVSLKKQTADAWYITCKKLKTNTNKDDPKTMDLVVAKGTYMPISLSATVSMVTVTLRNLAFGVTEDQVTFNPANYPGVTIIDKR